MPRKPLNRHVFSFAKTAIVSGWAGIVTLSCQIRLVGLRKLENKAWNEPLKHQAATGSNAAKGWIFASTC
jgi:hypothetical protein